MINTEELFTMYDIVQTLFVINEYTLTAYIADSMNLILAVLKEVLS
jgi:hypothetical protein